MDPRIRELAQQAGLLPVELGPVVETPHMKKKQESLEKFAEMIIRDLVSTMQVDGSEFYYNDFNEYGSVTVQFFVDCDPAHEMCGDEVKALHQDGVWKGTGRYRLNDRFVEYLLKKIS